MAFEKKHAILQVVSQVPKGKVATYGQIAAMAGIPGAARLVGHTLKNLPTKTTLPWHRVINAQLRVSSRSEKSMSDQTDRLMSEGIEFRNQRVARKHLWHRHDQ